MFVAVGLEDVDVVVGVVELWGLGLVVGELGVVVGVLELW